MKKSLIIISAILLAACSSPKDANKANFSEAINKYYAQQKVCINTGSRFPREVSELAWSNEKSTFELLDEFVSVGLLSVENSEKTIPASRSNKEMRTVRSATYTLTEKGEKFSAPEQLLSRQRFCYGEAEVVEITNFTEPEEIMYVEVTASEVNYTYQVNNIADWAKNSELLKERFKEITIDINSAKQPIKEKAALVLTNEGWLHEKLY